MVKACCHAGSEMLGFRSGRAINVAAKGFIVVSATRLLVLGLVRSLGRAHGYVISKELLAWEVDRWANTKTGSIYHALRTLTAEGLLTSLEVAASDFGPPRIEYEITVDGDTEFFVLMRQALSVPDTRPDALCAGLCFLTALSRDEALRLFRQRLAALADKQQIVRDHIPADGDLPEHRPQHIESLLGYWEHYLRNASDWTAGMIRTLESGAYAFAGEDAALAQDA